MLVKIHLEKTLKEIQNAKRKTPKENARAI
jgi:hypothetical protein